MKAVLLYVLWCAGFFVGIWLADVATGWLYDGESYAVWWIIFLFFLPFTELASFTVLLAPLAFLWRE